MPVKTRSAFDRWNDKVERSEDCWLWTGAQSGNGYGLLQRGPRGAGLMRAHRFSYEHHVGPIPAGLEIRHSCHTRLCVNPDHLSAGTRLDNMRDMVEAGRWGDRDPMRGERNGFAKLTESQARSIKSDRRLLREIAADYGVSITTIWSIRSGNRWQHV